MHRITFAFLTFWLIGCTQQSSIDGPEPLPAPPNSASDAGPVSGDPIVSAKTQLARRQLALAMPRLREHVSKSAQGLVVSQRPDGLKQIDLRGRFHHAHVAIKVPDGSTQVQCVTGVHSLDALNASAGAP